MFMKLFRVLERPIVRLCIIIWIGLLPQHFLHLKLSARFPINCLFASKCPYHAMYLMHELRESHETATEFWRYFHSVL